MNKVSEFVEEGDHVGVLHQSRIIGGRSRKIADEDRLRQLFAANAVEHRNHLRMTVLSRTRMQIKIKASSHLTVVVNIPGLDRWVPRWNVLLLSKLELKELRSCIENSFLHAIKRQIRTH